MLDVVRIVIELGTQLTVGIAAVFGVRFAWRLRTHNRLTEHREDKSQWRADTATGIENYLQLRHTGAGRGGFDLTVLHLPYRNPRIRGPYYAVSGAKIDEPAEQVKSLVSHDMVKPELIDALVEGLGLLGLGALTQDREWLLANTLLGGAGDDIERRSTELMPASSVPTAERNKYRFALVRHEPFVVWVYLMDENASRRKVSREPQWPGCAAHHPHSTDSTPRRTPTPGLGSPRRAARRQPKCECGGIAIGHFLPRQPASPKQTARRGRKRDCERIADRP